MFLVIHWKKQVPHCASSWHKHCTRKFDKEEELLWVRVIKTNYEVGGVNIDHP